MNTIILHGWGHNRSYWKNIEDRLKNTQAWDLPGFGEEKLVSPDWDIPDYADWVDKKIKSKKYKKVLIIGHSFGGKIAGQLASHNPKYLRGLILIGAPCIYRPSLKVRTKIKIFKSFKKLAPAFLKKYVYSDELLQAEKDNLGQILRKNVIFDETESLQSIKVPTLLLWGENDFTVPLEIAQEMHRLIPNSHLKLIPDSGHSPQFDTPELLVSKINEFKKTI